MKFTKEKPTKPGYYWCKLIKDSYYERDEDISMPVEVVLELEDNYHEFLVVYFLGEAFFKELDEPFFDNSKWAGPIPEPDDEINIQLGNEHLLGTDYNLISPEPDLEWGDHIEVRDSIDDTWHKAIYIGPTSAGGYACSAILVNHHAITLWAFFRPSNW